MKKKGCSLGSLLADYYIESAVTIGSRALTTLSLVLVTHRHFHAEMSVLRTLQ